MPNKKQSQLSTSVKAEPAQFDGKWLGRFDGGDYPGLEITVTGCEGYVENGGWYMDIVEFNPPLLRFIIREYPKYGIKEVNDVRKA